MHGVVRGSAMVAGAVALGLSFAAGAAAGTTPAAQAAGSYGAQVTLPFTGLDGPFGVAVDQAGDVFVADIGNERVVELPAGATSSSQQVTLPFTGLSHPIGVAVDGAGDVYAADNGNNRVVELPAGGDATQTSVSCAPAPVQAGHASTCTATVTDTSTAPVSVPSGPVNFTSTGPGSFAGATGQCTLAPVAGSSSQASCQVSYTQNQQGLPQITASYAGDIQHMASSATITLSVYQPLAGNGTCTGVFGGTAHAVTVPAGASCTLVSGTDVSGTVTDNGGSLTVSGGTVGGIIGNGGTLTLTGSTTGNITTGQDATLTVTSSTINGNVQGQNAGTTTLAGPCTTVTGNVTQTWSKVLNDANLNLGTPALAAAGNRPARAGPAAASDCASGPGSGVTVKGNVQTQNANTATVSGPCTMIGGNVTAGWNQVQNTASLNVGTGLAAASNRPARADTTSSGDCGSGPGSVVTVNGNVQVSKATAATVTGPGVTINGNLQVQELDPGTMMSLICAAQVTHTLVWQSNAAPVTIGGPNCPGNAIGGNLEVQNNTMPAGYNGPAATIENNTITGNLTVQHNTPAATVSGNTVGGQTQ